MADLTIVLVSVLSAVLLAATTYVAAEYFRQLRKAKREYEKAKEFVGDIVLSFNRELKREAEQLEKVAFKVEVANSTADSGYSKAQGIEKKLPPLETQVIQLVTQVESITTTIRALSEASAKTVERIAGEERPNLGMKLRDFGAVQENLQKRISTLEDQVQKLVVHSEAAPDAPLPVLPIKRDKALASLTETEVAVLEFLSAEGPKTAPEIKIKVNLSREHTARLMKKLYEEGYLERETMKLPFKYSVKKEMEKLLSKPEPTA